MQDPDSINNMAARISAAARERDQQTQRELRSRQESEAAQQYEKAQLERARQETLHKANELKARFVEAYSGTSEELQTDYGGYRFRKRI